MVERRALVMKDGLIQETPDDDTLYGSLGGGGGGGGSYAFIGITTVAAGSASLPITAIPAGYRDLILAYRGNTTDPNTPLYLRFNGSSANEYDWELDSRFEYGGGLGTTQGVLCYSSGTPYNPNDDVIEATIYGYSQAVLKHVMSRGYGMGGGNFFSRNATTRWHNNAAITDILIYPASGTMGPCRVELYGRG